VGKGQVRSPTRLSLGSVAFFLLYINDLSGSINNLSKPTLFADDTNIIFTHPNPSKFKEIGKILFEETINWFQ
jgi:hypothetical protein